MIWMLVGCGGGLDLESTAPPFDASGAGDFYADVAYDEHERTAFDLLLPEGEGPFPVVFYIHGGGFTAGEKELAWEQVSDHAQAFLDQGIAYGSIGYRLLADGDPDGVLKPLGDTQHAVQFSRYHADDLSIDPERLAVYGASAGAGAAMWLGTHDDLADPDAENKAWRESSRPVAAGAIETQATYDLVRWEEQVFDEYGITLSLAAAFGLEQRLLDFYAAPSIDAIYNDPDVATYRAEVDMLGLIDSTDAPLYVRNAEYPVEYPTSTGVLLHHAYHAREVAEAAADAGLTYEASIPGLGIEAENTVVEFLSARL